MNKADVDIICPLITPLDADGEPSEQYTKILLEDMTEFGINKIFPLGSNGLFSLLSMEKRKKFLKIIVDNSDGFEIITGIGSQNTEEAVEFAKFAEDLGVKQAVLQPTYYIKAEQSWMVRHFEKVSEVFNGDLYIYNIPQFTGSRFEFETIENIIDICRIKGLKDSSGDIRYFNSLTDHFKNKISVYQGQDDLLLQSLIIGAKGGVCGTTNINPLAVNVYRKFISGDIEEAANLQQKLIRLYNMINAYPFPSLTYASFYKKHNIKGKIPEPITTMEKIPELKVKEIIDFVF